MCQFREEENDNLTKNASKPDVTLTLFRLGLREHVSISDHVWRAIQCFFFLVVDCMCFFCSVELKQQAPQSSNASTSPQTSCATAAADATNEGCDDSAAAADFTDKRREDGASASDDVTDELRDDGETRACDATHGRHDDTSN